MSTEEALRPVCLLYGQPAILACLQKQKRAHFSGILATISIYQKPLYTVGLGLLDRSLQHPKVLRRSLFSKQLLTVEVIP